MSDLGKSLHVVPSRAQLPVSAYFDQDLFHRELEVLFKQGPGYLGHQLMVPEQGDFQTLVAQQHGRMLMHGLQGIECLSNVCRHRQALMLEGRGHTDQIVCPLHRWTYDLGGRLIGAPHFAEQPCLHLPRQPLQNWHGLLFDGPRNIVQDLAGLKVADQLDFTGYRFHRQEVHECPYNWKTFIEVYLEDYHVAPFHPGLGKFVDCESLDWQFDAHYSVQTVGVHKGLKQAGSPVYRQWQDEVLKFRRGEAPRHGAIWLTYFPHVMVESYPNVLVVSHLIPRTPQHTTNIVEFYYPEEIALFEPALVAAEQAAYMETCREDDEIGVRMDRGRKVLYDRGENDAGPYQTPMEDGMAHFHAFYRRQMGMPVAGECSASSAP